MRVLHTSDWHLGHSLYDQSREYEHACFLRWLVDTLERERVDALLLAGDVFDTANPSAAAQAAWYGFLANVRARMPALDVVVIGGNHDSAARLDAPVPLLRHLRVHIIGGLPSRAHAHGRAMDIERLIVPLHDASGQVAAYVAAVPFLRVSDLPRRRRATGDSPDAPPADVQSADPPTDPLADPLADPLIWGVKQIYDQVLDAARAHKSDAHALLAMGHCYMVGTELSRLSERRILGGNQHALPVRIFPEDVTYVALGHLHKAQRVGGQEHVRYSGAPLPLSLEERRNQQQVLILELDGPTLVDIRSLPVPRAVAMMRIPERGAMPLDQLEHALAALPDMPDDAERCTRPYLEVCALMSRPDAQLKQRVERALAGKLPRLVKLALEYTGDGAALAEVAPGESLRDLEPGEVFQRRYRRDHQDDPAPELVAAFHELLDQVARREVP